MTSADMDAHSTEPFAASDATRARVSTALEGIPHRHRESRDGMVGFEVDRTHVRSALERLHVRAGFETNTLVTSVDHLGEEPRFEVVWQFLSLEYSDRVRLATRVGEEDPRVPSGADLWPGMSFSERECFDMFGLRFEGHPDLRRLLMPEEYEHHPLRKDFPHEGIEPRKLYDAWDRERRSRRDGEPG